MTRPQTIATRYSSYSDQAFIDLGQNILAGMTKNPGYPDPPQPLDDLAKLLAELNEAQKAMQTGLRAATQQRNYLRQQAEAAFKALSLYAATTTPNRPDLWAATNFPLTKAETAPRPASQPVTGLTLTDGPSVHTMAASVEAQRGMYGYQWRIFPKDTTPEQLAAGFCYRFCTTRKPKVLIDNLASGTTYGVECAAWNETGPLQWSLPVFRIVQ